LTVTKRAKEKKQGRREKRRGGWEPGVVAHACDPSTQEAEAGGSQVQIQPWLHSEILSQKSKHKN
jgi:hypothetical protein